MASNQPAIVYVKSGKQYAGTFWALVNGKYQRVNTQNYKYSVVSNGSDYLVCNPVNTDGSINTSVSITMMKPWTLRRTPFDGHTVDGISYTYSDNATRSATNGTNTETQKITPSYGVGDLLYAEEMLPTEQANGITVYIIDSNTDGRAWAKS